jgi:hypothetical protein
MFGLKGRQDKFRVRFPKEFLLQEIEEKYTKVLIEKHSFFVSPIEFLNESIQSIQILGFTGASMVQQQMGIESKYQNPTIKTRIHTFNDHIYRSEKNPVALIDKTINIVFRHTLGFTNYFMMFENFFKQYDRATLNKEMTLAVLPVDVMNEYGEIYARVLIHGPIIDAMDMLDLSYTQPIAQSQTFQVTFKYSNIEFEFISEEDENDTTE